MAMREIKFRAWLPIDEHEGSDHSGNTLYEMTYDLAFEEYAPINDLLGIVGLNLMQYTGLKDKNGVEIYEGDIIEYSTTIKATETTKHIDYAEVVFNNGCFMYLVHDKDDNYYASLLEEDEKQWAEVIGNIYENGELLEQ